MTGRISIVPFSADRACSTICPTPSIAICGAFNIGVKKTNAGQAEIADGEGPAGQFGDRKLLRFSLRDQIFSSRRQLLERHLFRMEQRRRDQEIVRKRDSDADVNSTAHANLVILDDAVHPWMVPQHRHHGPQHEVFDGDSYP